MKQIKLQEKKNQLKKFKLMNFKNKIQMSQKKKQINF